MNDRESGEQRGLWALLDNPYPWLTAGAGGVAVALAWVALGEAGAAVRVVVLVLGLLATGAGVAIRPASPIVLGSAAAVGLLGSVVLQPWDSARLMLLFLSGLALASAGLMLLPVLVRRAIVGVLIVFHFLGILSAVFSVPPAPWLATNAWAYVFRPYLEFMYLNNAYHFYSPDPGPPNLLWFRLEYEDGSKRWYKMPNREDYPTSVNYQRGLSMTESTHYATVTDPGSLRRRQQLREAYTAKIPLHPLVPDALQFREPNVMSKLMIQDYARFVAQAAPLPPGPGKVKRVRLYRVTHDILEGRSLALGADPLDRHLYRPYYQGEFDAEGTLLDPNDPMLYWLVPIIKKDERTGWVAPHPESLERVTARDRTYEVYDYLKVHAGAYQ